MRFARYLLPAVLFAAAPCFAQSGTVDAQAASLLRRMMQAEATTPYTACEETFRADAPGASHVVKSDPKQGVRRESAKGKGRVSVTPFGKGKPRLNVQGMKRVEDLFNRLSKGALAATVEGQDTVAGRKCDIVEVRATRLPDAPTRRFWIDRATGLRLRTEEKSATGKLLSGSYYTSLDLTPTFAPDDFVPTADTKSPKGGSKAVRDRRRFKSVDEAKKAGFAVSAPTYLPSGYTLRAVEATAPGDFYSLRYANGLNALSLTMLKGGVPPRVRPLLRGDGSAVVPFPQGRKGLFVRGNDRAAYLLIGELPEAELRKIAASIP